MEMQFLSSFAWFPFHILNVSLYCSVQLHVMKLERTSGGNNWVGLLKDTSYVCGKKLQNLQLLDILACTSANRWYINRDIDQNIQKLLIFAVFAAYIASILNTAS